MRDDNFNASQVNSKNETMILDDTELGDIKIHESVIASLARRAALSVPGISRLAGSSLVDNLAEMVGSRRMQSRAVTVILGEESKVEIEIKVVLEFGYCIPDVAAQAQTAVVELVENTTGMSVVKVDILVQEIDDPEKEELEDGAADAVNALPLN